MQNGDVCLKNNQDNVKKKQFGCEYSERNKRDKMILGAKIYLMNKGKNGLKKNKLSWKSKNVKRKS